MQDTDTVVEHLQDMDSDYLQYTDKVVVHLRYKDMDFVQMQDTDKDSAYSQYKVSDYLLYKDKEIVHLRYTVSFQLLGKCKVPYPDKCKVVVGLRFLVHRIVQ